MNKKRILCCSEASFLSSGYGVYTKELLRGLWKTGKYEIAELARYCEVNDARLDAPWVVYPNMPNKQNNNEYGEYSQNIKNHFGKWRFNDTVLDFKPDYVISIADIWMDDYIAQSALRRYYKWLWMATVDSAPQDDAWFEYFFDADALFFYSDWGKNIVANQGGSRANIQAVTPAAVETDLFKPVVDKEKHRQKFGLNPNLFIIGSVMRNQKRKLFPDLIQSFRKYLDKCKENGNDDLYNRSYLYLHTTYPDIGWEIPELLKEHGVASKTIVTYRCIECNHAGISFFNSSISFCPKCGKYSYGFPSTERGVSREFLSQVYNLFDVSVQYSIAEGQGLPIVEAASCGVPVMVVNYSAMEDAVNKLGATPIDVIRLFREAETNSYRAYPDNDDFVEKLYSFAKLPLPLRKKKGFETYRNAVKHYKWSETVNKWDSYIDNDILSPNPERQLKPVVNNIPNNLNNVDFLKWCFVNILNEPEKISNHQFLKMVKWLNFGARVESRGGLVLPDDSVIGGQQGWAQYSREKCIEEFKQMRNDIEHWEARRRGLIKIEQPEFIKFAHNRTVKNGQVQSVNS